jgi:glutaredoxin-related protein
MNNYYLHSIILQNCPYSNAAYESLKNYPKIKTKFTFVNDLNKENYKTDQIKTFPQIYLKRENKNGSLLIGGYTELKQLLDLFYKTKYSKNNITEFINNNNKWSRKSLLRFIELINS